MSVKYRIIPIGGGGGPVPTGTISITENGQYDVTEYASADVDVERLPILTMTQAEYDALAPDYDPDTIYLIS